MKPVDSSGLQEPWPERQRRWAVKLGRIQLGVEPVEEQLEKYRRVTWMITIVTGWIAFVIAALFVAFKSPGTGLLVSGVLFGPIIISAWLGYRKLEAKVRAYLREKAEVERVQTP